ncbi:hypothetical protein [Sneathiella aquimaris]|uniref:hypothetical protein n=1 Tax=Sneathiella aquimaris TaxID=2599305 RepID=UPI00146B5FB7|nr:hypothetical protein [Sneathiella aquimaris]
MSYSVNPILKNTLLLNAAFSLVSALICLIFNDFFTDLLGLNKGLYLYILGAGLIVFAIDVAYTATRDAMNLFFVKIIIGADFLWVAASFGLTLLAPHWFSVIGVLLIELIALSVLIFAILQIIGLMQTLKADQVEV